MQANKCYGYKVTARDSVTPTANTGTASSIATTYTSANTPGTPTLSGATQTTLNLTNAENGNPSSNPTTSFAVQVTYTSPNDATWLNKWVDGSGNPSATAVWLTDAQLDALVLQGLKPSTPYGVKVKAKNQNDDETSLSAEHGHPHAPRRLVAARAAAPACAPGAELLRAAVCVAPGAGGGRGAGGGASFVTVRATARSSAPAPPPAPSFEGALERLEAIVARLESGELPLEQALAAFEEGVALSRRCASQLEAAERRIEQLVGDGAAVPFAPEDDVPDAGA